MDEIKLRYFISVARHKSFSKAAQELHVVQPTVSRQISLLEESLGAPLFYRDTHQVTLTPAGERLYKNAPAYMVQFQAIRENAANLMRQNETRFSIASGPFEFPLMDALARLYQQADPEVELHLIKAQYKRLNNHMRAGTMKLSVSTPLAAHNLPESSRISLGAHRWKAVARKDSSFWALPPEQQAALEGQKLVRMAERDYDPINDWLTTHPTRHRGISLASAFATICVQVSLGGVAILPEYLEPWLPAGLRMEQVFPEPPEVESVLIFDPRQALPQERQFFECIRAHYKP